MYAHLLTVKLRNGLIKIYILGKAPIKKYPKIFQIHVLEIPGGA